MKLTRVFSIVAMLLIVFMSGCKKDPSIEVSPMVTSIDPVDKAISVAVNSKISATFSVEMDSSTITIENFTLYQGTANIAGAVTYTGKVATFTPTANLAPNTIFTATVTEGVKNKSGKSLAANYISTFTTGAIPDISIPSVTSIVPGDKATSIAVNSKISATFSVNMDSTTITTANFTINQGTVKIAGLVTYTNKIATFTPTANLEPNTIYTATISAVVKDKSGKPMATAYITSFTTGAIPDVTSPTVTLADPLNNAKGVMLNKVVSLTFSEAMSVLTINTTTFTLKQGTTTVSGTVAFSGTIATFTPSNALAANMIYTATITIGAKDLAGNAIASAYITTFTTAANPDIILPTVTITDPLNNATGVARSKVIALTFSEAMDDLTINTTTFTLKQGTTAVSGIVAYSGTIATFTPSNALESNLVYTATITTGAKDIAGNALAANTEWNFTTVATVSGLAVVNLRAAGNYVILAKTEISNVATSAVTGDLGLSPAATSYITGFALTNATGYATASQVTGKIYAADMAAPTGINLTTAVENMLTAYTDAAGRPTPDFTELYTGNLGGKTLTPGLYKWTNNVTLPSNVTISGSATDVWIFQISGNLNMSSAVKITLNGGAQAKNIFWQVAGQATLGTTSHFEGIILSKTGITFQTGASINGRALAQSAVILDKNTVTQP